MNKKIIGPFQNTIKNYEKRGNFMNTFHLLYGCDFLWEMEECL
jgi:hypothetical protein